MALGPSGFACRTREQLTSQSSQHWISAQAVLSIESELAALLTCHFAASLEPLQRHWRGHQKRGRQLQAPLCRHGLGAERACLQARQERGPHVRRPARGGLVGPLMARCG